jgi:hypothetical protein
VNSSAADYRKWNERCTHWASFPFFNHLVLVIVLVIVFSFHRPESKFEHDRKLRMPSYRAGSWQASERAQMAYQRRWANARTIARQGSSAA